MSAHKPCKDEFLYKGIVWNNYTTLESLQRIETFEFRPSDICVCTFPRSGTTLTQEIIWQIKNRRHVQKDQKFADIDERFPFLEFNVNYGKDVNDTACAVDVLKGCSRDDTRLIKTHCPYSFIKETFNKVKPKTVVVIRNPKDCAASLFHFYRGLEMYGPWDGSWDDFFNIFVSGKTMCGDWFEVLLEWWKLKGEPYILFVKFEDLIEKPDVEVKKIASFIGETLTEDELDLVMHNSHFKTMSKNTVNFTDDSTGFQFLRKGKVGDWKNLFTDKQNVIMNDLIHEKLDPAGIQFTYEF